MPVKEQLENIPGLIGLTKFLVVFKLFKIKITYMNSYNLTLNYSINKFYFLIQLFIILQVFGAYGGLFQPTRVFFIFGIPFLLYHF